MPQKGNPRIEFRLGVKSNSSDLAATTTDKRPNDVRRDAALIPGCIGNALIKDLETLIQRHQLYRYPL